MGRLSNGPTSKRAITARTREDEALDLRRAGASYTLIAERLNVSRGTAWNAVNRALKRLDDTCDAKAERVLTLELERLDRALLAIWPRVTAGDVQAIDRLLRISKRRAEMLGSDAPLRSEVSGPNGQPIEHRVISESELDAEIRELLAGVGSLSGICHVPEEAGPAGSPAGPQAHEPTPPDA